MTVPRLRFERGEEDGDCPLGESLVEWGEPRDGDLRVAMLVLANTCVRVRVCV